MESISLILPVYNEVDVVADAIERSRAAFIEAGCKFEIIVIDDGSKDGTAAVVKKFVEQDSRIRLLENFVNLNQGASQLRGFSQATMDLVVHNGIDLPLSPERIPAFAKLMNNTDILVIEKQDYTAASFYRRFVSQLNQNIRMILFPVSSRGIRHMNFIQIYRRSIMAQIFPLARSPAFTVQEMILRGRRLGLRIKLERDEVQARKAGISTLGRPHDMLWGIYDMFRFRILTLLKKIK